MSDKLQELRKPFPDHQISYLPLRSICGTKVTCTWMTMLETNPR